MASQMLLPSTPPPSVSVSGPSTLDEIVTQLRTIAALDGLIDSEYRWLAQNSVEYRFGDGEHVFTAGDAADSMVILLAGEIHVRRRGGPVSFMIGRTGNLSGKLPFSRMQAWGGDGFAAGAVHMLRIFDTQFPEMLTAIPSMVQRSVSTLLDRVREVTRIEQQAEKLDALGKLAANLSHELNNPASAARSAAATLFQELRIYGDHKFRLGSMCLSDEDKEKYHYWASCVIGKAKELAGPERSAIEQSEREDIFNSWLSDHGIAEPWKWSGTIANSSIETSDLDEFAKVARPEVLRIALPAFISGMRAERMSDTVVEATARIFDFITAIQSYSYMDQAPIQEIDVTQSIDNAMTMFASRLANVHVVRDYAPVLPPVSVYGSEIAQVWSELIENALDAMQNYGTLTLRVYVAGNMMLVEVCDSGPGIPENLRSRIFEPFFTTKSNGGIGTGMGLGLDSVNRIVLKHRGQVSVKTEPGFTCIQVRLPIENVGAY